MPTNTVIQIPPVSLVASGTHSFIVSGPVPVLRGNKDVILTLGNDWAFIVPCRLSDYVTAIPNILDYKIEFFLLDLDQQTRVYYDNTTDYVVVTDTVDAQVQIFLPTFVQSDRMLLPGNYFYLVKTTAPDGSFFIQAKGRVQIGGVALPPPTVPDTDPYALSETPFVPAPTSPEPSIDMRLVFSFDYPILVWVVPHNLGRYPSITTVDTTGRRMFGEETYLDANNLSITWAAPNNGVTYLN